jgi:hypothetical protein
LSEPSPNDIRPRKVSKPLASTNGENGFSERQAKLMKMATVIIIKLVAMITQRAATVESMHVYV